MSRRLHVAIIGAGFAGLAAAYDLTKAGHAVTVYESLPTVGGLGTGRKAEDWHWSLEHYYHHWFTSDDQIIGLIEEIGAEERLFFRRPITATWYKGQAYQLDSPISLLRFPGLSFMEKFRTGLVLAYLRFIPRWRRLEKHTVHEWLPKYMGERAYEVLWKPLLIGKFDRYYKDVNMAWFWARVYKRSPELGYFEGGFQACAEAITNRMQNQGGELHLSTRVQAIESSGGEIIVRAAGIDSRYDACIATTSPRLLTRLVPQLPERYFARLKELDSLGAVVLTLALRRRLTRDLYWVNLPAGEFPFLVLVEHTNFIEPEHYDGDHLVYCGDYLPPDHEYFEMTKDELLDIFLPSLEAFNPDFERCWVRDSWLSRTPYAQPVPVLNYSEMIPDIRTPVSGLYFSSMSQVYPWDRGTNYAVELGRKVAAMVMEDV